MVDGRWSVVLASRSLLAFEMEIRYSSSFWREPFSKQAFVGGILVTAQSLVLFSLADAASWIWMTCCPKASVYSNLKVIV
jgi:hypothetical protein